MPSRWFVPVHSVDPERVRLEFVHAAFSRWFDDSEVEHEANDKPYAVSPMTAYRGRVGVEIATLSDDAQRQLEERARSGAHVRLGNQTRRVDRPVLLATQSWEQLESCPFEGLWRLELVTPTTFRSGDRSSPLPTMGTLMGGLARAWNRWSGREPRTFEPRRDGALWVSDLDLRSTLLRLKLRDRHGDPMTVHLSCALGSLTLRCDDKATAARVAPLLRLAPYAGIGSMRGKGLGVARLHSPTDAELHGTAG